MLAGIESSIEREVYAGRAAKMAGVTAEAMNIEVRRELGIRLAAGAAGAARSARRSAWSSQKDRTLAYTDRQNPRKRGKCAAAPVLDQKLIAGMEGGSAASMVFPRRYCVRYMSKLLALDRGGSRLSTYCRSRVESEPSGK